MDELTYEEAYKMSVENLLHRYIHIYRCLEDFYDWNGGDRKYWNELQKREYDDLVKQKLMIIEVFKKRCRDA